MFKKIPALLLALLFITAIFSGCGDNTTAQIEKVVVVLDYTPNTNHTGLYAAKDLGYYAEVGLDVEIIQPPEDGALALVATGRADFAVSYQEEIMVAATSAQPLPIKAIAALIEHNTTGLISLKERGINRFKDLEGKKLATWQIPIYDEIILECVRADGGDPEKVTLIPNNATDVISGIRNEFDAMWVYEGWDKTIADINGVENTYISFTSVNPVFDYYTPALVTNNNTLENKAELVKKFLDATEKGYTYAKENHKEAADIFIKSVPEVDADTVYASQEYLSGQYFSTKWGYIDESRWNAFANWMKEKGFIESSDTVCFANPER